MYTSTSSNGHCGLLACFVKHSSLVIQRRMPAGKCRRGETRYTLDIDLTCKALRRHSIWTMCLLDAASVIVLPESRFSTADGRQWDLKGTRTFYVCGSD